MRRGFEPPADYRVKLISQQLLKPHIAANPIKIAEETAVETASTQAKPTSVG